MGSQIAFCKKLTVATAGLLTSDLEAAAKGRKGVSVLRVGGFIDSAESKVSDIGPYTLFNGQFEGVNLLTGQVYRAGKMILNSVAETPLLSELGDMESGGRMKFVLEITVDENISSKGGTKFKYGVKSLLEPSQEDELSKLMKALPGPEKRNKK